MTTLVQNNSLFSIPVLDTIIDGFDAARRERISALLLELRVQDRGLNRSNQNGWHSANNLFRHEHPDLRWLIEQIYRVAAASIRELEGEKFKGDIPMVECWANISDAGSWNAPHIHLPNEWSGVFYVSVEEAASYRATASLDGDILFINPSPGGPLSNRPPCVNRTPKDGQMLLFPGYLLHMVAPHQAPVPRISLAFNFRLTEKLPPPRA